MATLAARHLSKSYRSRQVVKDVSLTVRDGEIVGLLGPNGAGKTTSFHMIVGLVHTDSGTIHLDKREISKLPIDRRALLGLGYLPQETSIFRSLTVAQNILAVLEIQGALDKEQMRQRLEELLREFKIDHLRDCLGRNLSGGERRRVEIARALAIKPRFLLLDEPYAGIDPITVNDIQNTIRYLSDRGIGVLITDHNVRETLASCDHAYIVNDGRIIASGATDEILANEQVRKAYLGDGFRL